MHYFDTKLNRPKYWTDIWNWLSHYIISFTTFSVVNKWFSGWNCDVFLSKDGSFNTLVNLIYDLGFAETLKGVDAVTIFAPTDEAFAKAFPGDTFKNLNSKKAKDIISRHIIAGATIKARTNLSSGWQTRFGKR